MLELLGLRWAMGVTTRPKADSFRSLFEMHSSIVEDEPVVRKPIPRPREGGEDEPWWDRKVRYSIFEQFAKDRILRAACNHNLGASQINSKSLDVAYFKALGKILDKKVSLSKLPNVGAEKTFAASILYLLDPKLDLEQVDLQAGGLSHLLFKLEKALKLI